MRTLPRPPRRKAQARGRCGIRAGAAYLAVFVDAPVIITGTPVGDGVPGFVRSIGPSVYVVEFVLEHREPSSTRGLRTIDLNSMA